MSERALNWAPCEVRSLPSSCLKTLKNDPKSIFTSQFGGALLPCGRSRLMASTTSTGSVYMVVMLTVNTGESGEGIMG